MRGSRPFRDRGQPLGYSPDMFTQRPEPSQVLALTSNTQRVAPRPPTVWQPGCRLSGLDDLDAESPSLLNHGLVPTLFVRLFEHDLGGDFPNLQPALGEKCLPVLR